MDNRVKIIVGGAIVLLLLVVLTIFFFLSNVKKADNTEQSTLENLTTIDESVTPTPATSAAPTVTANQKVYSGTGFSLKYPSSWGVLSCTNSQNFELDPTSPNATFLACDTALKPITVLVTQNLNCQGTAINLGTHSAVKSKTTNATSYTTYRWCVPLSGGKALDITHRVDPKVSQATSKEDYSSQVEEIIKSITTSSQGS